MGHIRKYCRSQPKGRIAIAKVEIEENEEFNQEPEILYFLGGGQMVNCKVGLVWAVDRFHLYILAAISI